MLIFDVQFKYAQNPETRRKAHQSYESRLTVNVPLLDKALNLRREIAALLGYPTWADYITEVKMVKSAKGVTDVGSYLRGLEAFVDVDNHAFAVLGRS